MKTSTRDMLVTFATEAVLLVLFGWLYFPLSMLRDALSGGDED